MKPAKQVYSNYTTEDKLVWSTLFNRQMNVLAKNASSEFLGAMETIGFSANIIPNFQQVNLILARQTGWQITVVPQLCPPKEFFYQLGNRTFTATCWLRKFEQLDYLEEPDMFHDVFAHAPLLSNQELIEENNEQKIYGAGIISSKGETAHALSKVPVKEDFNLKKIIRHAFRTDVLQNHYYVIRSFDQLIQALEEVKVILKSEFGDIRYKQIIQPV